MSFSKFFFNSRVTTYEQHKTELFLIPLLVFTLIVKCFLFARYTRSQFKCSTDLCIENPTNPRTISVCYPFWPGVALSFQQRILIYKFRRPLFVKSCDMLSTYPLPHFSLFLFVVLRAAVGLCMWINKWYFVFRVGGWWGIMAVKWRKIFPTPLKYSLTRFRGLVQTLNV